MTKCSAGLMMFRRVNGVLQVLLVHPGGPYWTSKHEGAWGIAKGEYGAGEDPLLAAQREFTEETGFAAAGPFLELGSVKLKSGKRVAAWAFEGDCNPTELHSNTCEIEWPPRSGKVISIPEVDRGEWFTVARAAVLMVEAQRPLLIRLSHLLAEADRRESSA